MATEERMERLKWFIAQLERDPERHRAELARLYELLAVHQQATGMAALDTASRDRLPAAA
ncbi:MAG: hypothetical protein M3Q65_07095 [Chloroflexota bacterium]|nr:hypothetical protein [Chloroflexota bacterium]